MKSLQKAQREFCLSKSFCAGKIISAGNLADLLEQTCFALCLEKNLRQSKFAKFAG